jgi:hypothetical protein
MGVAHTFGLGDLVSINYRFAEKFLPSAILSNNQNTAWQSTLTSCAVIG